MTAAVCIVGAGPVGLSVADKCIELGLSVVVIESGGFGPNMQRTRRLAEAQVVGDDRFGLLYPRLGRAVGGASWNWCVDLPGLGAGVRYAAVEPGLFDRVVAGQPWWPIEAYEVTPWYAEALNFAQVRCSVNDLLQTPSSTLQGVDTAKYVFGPAAAYRGERIRSLFNQARVELLIDATLTEIVAESTGSSVRSVIARNEAGGSVEVMCGAVILATGTVDTTRILLNAQSSFSQLAANKCIGRNLMDRPRVMGELTLDVDPPDWFSKFALQRDGQSFSMERLTTPQHLVAAGNVSASFLLTPQLGQPVNRSNVSARVERLVKQALIDTPASVRQLTNGKFPGVLAAPVNRLIDGSYPLRAGAHRQAIRHSFDTEWSDWSNRAWKATRTWKITTLFEQFASPDNRIELTDELDPLGQRRARLVWGSPATVTPQLTAALAQMGNSLQASGLGSVTWENNLALVSSCHMLGTVPMGTDAQTSAANEFGNVRGVDNLFVAGNALIPQSGHANPTLIAMALGRRTAAHISEQG